MCTYVHVYSSFTICLRVALCIFNDVYFVWILLMFHVGRSAVVVVWRVVVRTPFEPSETGQK